ncbi:ABC transporter ATP-binding protein [Jiangella anatolica]|uniref:Daunorubicin/doxorubicin resistance ABC transporter ATP-binding protein DrrA n=1 Tax=Jiangella anatolica TaxID=2670374 RepID=A0A2W2BUD9_9ACTN|nr:ATP-binding cassette domain-containing protein [Jiangella anatolica]PZF83984.1 daunorubicin/doxorubicin resistance ABC transporter ATP-binding protein DrrA [Jiangella anatolica]
MGAAIEARAVRKHYRGAERPALDGFDLRVEAGTVCALLGRNGAGKTTAVRILTTLLDFDDGAATVAGHDVRSGGDGVRRAIGLVGQNAAVDEILGGRANLVLFGRLRGLSKTAARDRAAELITRFGLDNAAGRAVGTYSGGMRRRLDLAASLVVPPSVLFVDEPTTGLDPDARREVWATVRRLVDDGVTVLLTTQYLEEADELADHVAMLRDGRVVLEGSPAELTSLVGDTRVEATFGSPADAAAAARVARPHAVGPVHVTGASVAVPVADAAAVTRLCAALAGAGVAPVDLAVRRPTLDDVFTHVNTEGAR